MSYQKVNFKKKELINFSDKVYEFFFEVQTSDI